jgi:thymidylate synthase
LPEGGLMIYIEATNIDDCWHSLLFNIAKYGTTYKITSGSFEGNTRLEFPFVSGYIKNPHTERLAPYIPEGLSISPPTTDDEIYDYFANYLMNPVLFEHEEYRYSQWINEIIEDKKEKESDKIKTISALEWVIRHFKEKGHGNNHCCLTIGSNRMLSSYDGETKGSTPCLKIIDFKIKYGKLILIVYFRSWDLWSGFPTNIGGLTLLNQYTAGEIGVEPGPIAFSSGGMHCYDFQLKFLEERTYATK